MTGPWPALSVSTANAGASSRVSLIGEFDLSGVGAVENALDRAFRPAATSQVVVDLQRVTFLDGAGLRTILRAHQRALAAAIELVVVRPHGTANRVFTHTRAGTELNMIDPHEATA